MKKILLASLFGLFLSAFVSAQSINVVYQSGDTVTGPNWNDITSYIHFENSASGAEKYLAEKEDLSLASGHSSYFCWGVDCYPTSVFLATDTVDLNPGQVDSTFIGYLQPYDSQLIGHDGVSTIRYRIFNIADTSDKFEKVIVYVAGDQTSLSHTNVNGSDIYVYPNPATSDLNLVFENLNGTQGKVIIRNMLGSRVLSREVALEGNFVQLDLNDIPNGVYLYTLEVDGLPVVTKKFSVRK